MNKKCVVALDIGHGMGNSAEGRFDPGNIAVHNDVKYVEREICYRAAHALHEWFRGHPEIEIKLGQGGRLTRRHKPLDALNPDFILSIHCNWFFNSQANGSEIFYSARAPVARRNQAWALIDAYARFTPEIRNRGAKPDTALHNDGLWVCRRTKTPAFLIELGFLSNELNASIVTDWAIQGLVAVVNEMAVIKRSERFLR